jgi:hypothetical protein
VNVQTYKLSAEIEDLYAAGTAGGEMRVVDAARLLWIVQEYCDRGTLIDAGVYLIIHPPSPSRITVYHSPRGRRHTPSYLRD